MIFISYFLLQHMEEVETIQHSDGTTEKIVRQRQGDKTHTTTYRTDKDGHTEKSENFQNMDESKTFGNCFTKKIFKCHDNEQVEMF